MAIIPGTTRSEVLRGTNLADTINGLGGNDTLLGFGGNDRLNGGIGLDRMFGGFGNDTYIVDRPGDRVIEAARRGIDRVISSSNYTLGANVENLTLTGTAIAGSGNNLNNRITGNARNNRLFGGAGNDRLNGGRGIDSLYGSFGNDTYIVDRPGDRVIEAARRGIDTVISSSNYTLGANVENLTLTGTAIAGSGNNLNNRITGNARNNRLFGGAGNDRLNGGRGIDSLYGSFGNDTYIVDRAGDRVIEAARRGIDTVVSSTTYTLSANIENLTLRGNQNVDINGVGNNLNNRIAGGIQDNLLLGRGGNDVLSGGSGNDTLDGFSGGTGVQRDVLIGGLGDDVFVLGNRRGAVFYQGASRATIRGYDNNDQIRIFGRELNNTGTDLVELRGNGYDLRIGNVSGTLAPDTQIFYRNNLIAVVEDRRINASEFELVNPF